MVFSKMGFKFLPEDIENIVNCKPLAIEHGLRILKVKIEMNLQQRQEKKGNVYSSGPNPQEPTPPQYSRELPLIHKSHKETAVKKSPSSREGLRQRATRRRRAGPEGSRSWLRWGT
jgi:hypothetical protein